MGINPQAKEPALGGIWYITRVGMFIWHDITIPKEELKGKNTNLSAKTAAEFIQSTTKDENRHLSNDLSTAIYYYYITH